MQRLLLVKILAIVAIAILLLSCCVDAKDMSGPPARPNVFKNPQELRNYLKALNEYFAIVGRPR